RFSPGERMGSDCFLEIGAGESVLYGMLQLKQLARRSTVELQGLIDKAAAKRYADPERLYLAVAVNRDGEFDLGVLDAEALHEHFIGVWIFGRATGSRWFFYGDLLE